DENIVTQYASLIRLCEYLPRAIRAQAGDLLQLSCGNCVPARCRIAPIGRRLPLRATVSRWTLTSNNEFPSRRVIFVLPCFVVPAAAVPWRLATPCHCLRHRD